MMTRRPLFLLLVLCLAWLPTEQPAHARIKLESLSVATATGTRTFRVEVVDTPQTRERGLMFRKTLPMDQGMLFDFKEPRPVAFWMRNTPLSLDIVYIDAKGRIVSIARNTVPYSEIPIPSGAPALGVLEVNAGLTDRLNIQPGDRVRHRIFHP